MGYAVHEVNESKQVLPTIKNERIEVVCLDIDMPGTTGLALLKEIRSTGLPVATIMVAGRATLAHRIAAFRYGADFLFLRTAQKETDLAKLVEFCLLRLDEWRAAIRNLATTFDSDVRPSVPPVEYANDDNAFSHQWKLVRRERQEDESCFVHAAAL